MPTRTPSDGLTLQAGYDSDDEGDAGGNFPAAARAAGRLRDGPRHHGRRLARAAAARQARWDAFLALTWPPCHQMEPCRRP